MSAPTDIVFLPGFDGAAELRSPFVAALAERYPARAIGYPNRKLGTLAGYARFASSQVAQDARPILVAESFSGLVAARWAASDPHVAGLVLCGAFARSPMPWLGLGASMPSLTQFLGANVMTPFGRASFDPMRRQWSEAFGTALRSLDAQVLAERLAIIAAEDVSADLARIGVPIVLVQFDDDLIIGPSARSALEAFDESAGTSLDAVSAGLVEGLARLHVRRDARIVQRGEGHQRLAHRHLEARLHLDRDRAQHAMLGTCEEAQHAFRIVAVGGLAEDHAGEGDRGVGGEHRHAPQAATHHDALPRGARLQPSDALHVVVRHLAFPDRLVGIRIGARAVAKEERLEADADLGEELAPPRAARGEVDDAHGCSLGYSR